MARAIDGTIAERSRMQLGLLTPTDLEELDITRAKRRRLIANGVLAVQCGQILRHTAFPTSHEQAAVALAWANGPHAALTGLTTARAWRLDAIKTEALEVLIPHGARAVAPYGEVFHTRNLLPVDVTTLGLARVITPARTLIEIAGRVDKQVLEQAYDGAVRDGKVRPAFLRWRLEQLGTRGREGPSSLLALLDRTEGRPVGDCWLEQEAIRWIDRCGLPRPRTQATLRPRGGVARVDLIWDDAALIVEMMGHGTHATRRQRQRDAERRARVELLGNRVIEFVYEDMVERPRYVMQTIAVHLGVELVTDLAL